ncbi:MAG: DHH family phosphoesterase [bacterium]
MVGDLADIVRSHESFVVTTHYKPDGDAIGSELALYNFLSQLGKRVVVVSDPIPQVYRFLPGSGSVEPSPLPEHRRYDVLIAVDCEEVKRLKARDLVGVLPISVNIDHHPQNEGFGSHNFVNPQASASAEVIYNLIKDGGFEITYDVALCLYTATVADTGCFRYPRVTERTHLMAAELLDCGISPLFISKNLFESRSLSVIKLMGLALNTMETSDDGQVCWLYVTKKMFDATGTREEDTEGFVNYAESIEGVKVALFFRELGDGRIRVSFRSDEGVDVEEIARKFGGGGHKNASGCTLEGDIYKVMGEIIEETCASVART